MAMHIQLPKRFLAANIDRMCALVVNPSEVSVTVTRVDNGKAVKLEEAGNGSPEKIAGIAAAVRNNRRRYVMERIDEALKDELVREALGLPIAA